VYPTREARYLERQKATVNDGRPENNLPKVYWIIVTGPMLALQWLWCVLPIQRLRERILGKLLPL
jgi:hypothetical protein